MDSFGLWLGTLVCAALAALALLPLRSLFGRRWSEAQRQRLRLQLVVAALLVAPLLVAADNWQSARIVELRGRPELLVVALVLGAALITVLSRLFLRRPWLLVLTLVAVLPLRIPVELAGSTANLLLPLYVALAAALIAALIDPERVVPKPAPETGFGSWIGLALAAVLIVYALQASYSDSISVAVENVSFFFAPFSALYLLLVRSRWDSALLRAVVIIVVAEALIVAVVGFGQYATRELFWNDKVIAGNEAHSWFRVNSLFFDPNIMGRYLAVTMVALAAVVAWGRGRLTLLATASFVVLLLALALTFSQSSMLALIAGVLVVVLARWGIVTAALASFVVVAGLAISVWAVGEGGLTAETTGRTGLVSGGLEIAAERPVSGFGSGSFAPEFELRFGGGDGIAVVSHTEPVTVLAEQGAVGFIPYAALLAVTLGALVLASGVGLGPARDPVAGTLLAAFFAMVVHSLGYGAFLIDPITWALLALTAALPALAGASVRARPAPSEPAAEPLIP